MPPSKAPNMCASCHQPFQPTDVPSTYRNKQYHPSCLASMKNAARAKDARLMAKQNDPDLSALRTYICKVFSLPAVVLSIEAQIKDFHDKKKLSYADILLALQYFFEVQGHVQEDDSLPTIGIVPYVFEEAKAFQSVLNSAKEANLHFTPSAGTSVVPVSLKKTSVDFLVRIEDL